MSSTNEFGAVFEREEPPEGKLKVSFGPQHPGSGICSQTILRRGIILRVTVPSTMRRSHCLSEPKASRSPNLSMSHLEPDTAPSSVLQQPVSMWTGQRE